MTKIDSDSLRIPEGVDLIALMMRRQLGEAEVARTRLREIVLRRPREDPSGSDR